VIATLFWGCMGAVIGVSTARWASELLPFGARPFFPLVSLAVCGISAAALGADVVVVDFAMLAGGLVPLVPAARRQAAERKTA